MYQNMELNEINENYKKAQVRISKLGPAKAKIESLKKEIKPLTRTIEDLSLKKNRAQEDGDHAIVQQADSDLKKFKAELKMKSDTLKKLEEMISKAEAELDNHLESLKQMEQNNPEFLEHMNTVIAKKFSRKANALKNEKKELTSRNVQLEIIKEAAKKDPYVMNTLKGIDGYKKAIEQLSNSKDPNDIQKLSEAKSKLNDRRKDLKTYFKGSISDDVINSLSSFSNIDKDIKSNTRQIKGIDKSIANYRTALVELGYTLDDTPVHSVFFDSKGNAFTDIHNSFEKESDKNSNKALLPVEKPKWYQFIKRFKNWRNSKKIEAENKLETEAPSNKEKPNKFRDSMKYDIVRDYEAKLEQDLLKNAKAQNKEARANEDNEQSR